MFCSRVIRDVCTKSVGTGVLDGPQKNNYLSQVFGNTAMFRQASPFGSGPGQPLLMLRINSPSGGGVADGEGFIVRLAF